MKRVMKLGVAVSLSVAGFVSATVAQGIDIAFASIGNPCNPGATRGTSNPSGVCAVAYTYQPGNYELTNEVI